MLGQPIATLRVSADRPRAFVAARLCDVAPDGASTVITRGFLNLVPSPTTTSTRATSRSASRSTCAIAMKSVAYAVPAGHTVRLALSTSYWPWLWPSPEPVALTVHTGGASTLELPVRTPHALDDALPPLGPPEIAPRLAVEILDPARPRHEVTEDVVAGTTTFVMSRRFAGARRFPSGLEYRDDDPITFTITGEDPLSPTVECRRRIEVARGDAWSTRIEVLATMTCDASRLPRVDRLRGLRGRRARPHPHRNRIDPEGLLMTVRLKRLDNIDVVCTDVDALVAFYGGLLGLELRLPYERGQGWAGFRAGDVVIYFIEEEGAGEHPAPRFTGAANPPGIDSFAFEVDSLDDAIAELDGQVPWAGEIVASEWYRYRGMHDPEGNLVYLTEPLLDR